MNRSRIDEYERGSGRLRTAIAGLDRRQMIARPADGSWSIQQIVCHLLDAELIYADRMKRVIAEENPTLLGFDQSAFAEKLHAEEQSADDAVTIIELNRRNMTHILRKLPNEAFGRIGTHNERGPLTLELLLAAVTKHMDHHLAFIDKKSGRKNGRLAIDN